MPSAFRREWIRVTCAWALIVHISRALALYCIPGPRPRDGLFYVAAVPRQVAVSALCLVLQMAWLTNLLTCPLLVRRLPTPCKWRLSRTAHTVITLYQPKHLYKRQLATARSHLCTGKIYDVGDQNNANLSCGALWLTYTNLRVLTCFLGQNL